MPFASRPAAPGAAVLALALLAGCRPAAPPVLPVAAAAEPLAPTPGRPWFVDVTAAAKIDFRHFDPATPRHFIQETMGSGLAWIDFDADGWPDLFCVQQAPLRPGGPVAAAGKLYRNNRDGTFADVTEQVGLARTGFGMGVAVGDYDNDGFDDLLLTFYGGLALYHNEPDGRGGRKFVDVTPQSGLSNPHWATSAAWGDLHGTGRLDLYVCNYCEVNLDKYPDCSDARTGEATACPPSHFAAVPHRLFRNDGAGKFTDITASSGVAAASASPGLAVVIFDLDGDGKQDIYVANDMKPAFLFRNLGGGKFEERASLAGCGVGPDGALVAGMGVAAADVDGSGRPSLFVTNFERKPNVLHLNLGNLRFADRSMPSGLGGPSVPKLKFGCAFLDADLDGKPDLAVANGHIHRAAEKVFGVPYGQEAQFFTGDGKGKFKDESATAGAYFREKRVGRGLAVADFDNDGRPDLAFSHVGGPVALLRNETSPAGNWLRLELLGDGVTVNRNAIGAKVEVDAGGAKRAYFVLGGGSYLSASDRRLSVGLGAATTADITVTWPGGRRQEFKGLAANRGHSLAAK